MSKTYSLNAFVNYMQTPPNKNNFLNLPNKDTHTLNISSITWPTLLPLIFFPTMVYIMFKAIDMKLIEKQELGHNQVECRIGATSKTKRNKKNMCTRYIVENPK